MSHRLKSYRNKRFNFNYKFGLFLIQLLCIPRFILVLHSNQIGNIRYVDIMMLFLAIGPFIFLTKHGWYQNGINRGITLWQFGR